MQAFYAQDPDREWERMARHRTEFAVTLRALKDHLPPPPAAILDCGGGPGRYAIELTQRGYHVTLFDLSPELLMLARERATEAGVTLAGFEEGTAIDLDRFDDGEFDAVLLMGPLYHLLDETKRRQALAEARRVVKPGGPVFAAFIARYAGHIDAAAGYPERAAEIADVYRHIATNGVEPPGEAAGGRFVAYFAHPDEIEPLCRAAGLEPIVLLGVEGVVSGHEDKVNALSGDAWDFWVETNYQIGHDPSLHGGVEHLLAICRHPKWRPVLRQLAEELHDLDANYRVVGGASLALRGLPVEVHDLDLEMDATSAYALMDHYADHTTLPLAWRENASIRSHFGHLEIDGFRIEIITDLERRLGERWVPSFVSTNELVDLDGAAIHVTALEEETLAYVRRGRLERAAVMLPHCDAARLLDLLRRAVEQGRL